MQSKIGNSSLGVPESGERQTRLGFSFRDPEFSFYRDLAEIGQKRAGPTISPFFAVHAPLPFPSRLGQSILNRMILIA
jgi:hypothetical protein